MIYQFLKQLINISVFFSLKLSLWTCTRLFRHRLFFSFSFLSFELDTTQEAQIVILLRRLWLRCHREVCGVLTALSSALCNGDGDKHPVRWRSNSRVWSHQTCWVCGHVRDRKLLTTWWTHWEPDLALMKAHFNMQIFSARRGNFISSSRCYVGVKNRDLSRNVRCNAVI